MADKVDNAPDADLEQSNTRAENAHTLSTEDALAALTGRGGAPEPSPFEDDSLSNSAASPDAIEEPMVDAASEELDDDDGDSLPDDSDDSTKQTDEESTDEMDESTADESDDEIGDLFIGLGEDGEIGATLQNSKSAQQPDGPLTDNERYAKWQARANKFEQSYYDAQKTIRERDATIAEQRSAIAALQAKAGAPAFDKQPTDFMSGGDEYIPEDRGDPSTPTGRAYAAYSSAYAQYQKDQFKAELRAEQAMEKQQEAQKASYESQVAFLKSRRGNEFKSQDTIDELIQWSSTVGDKGLYALSITRDIMNGQFRLPKSVIDQLAAKLKPSGRNGKSTIATKPDANTPEAAPKVNSDTRILHKMGFLDA